jgi:hypothetical protein
MSRFSRLESRLAGLRQDVVNHQIYEYLSTMQSLHLLMQGHVFAVWDFMSLLKALQRQLTCVQVPWRPAKNRAACRLINELVLAEESDVGPDGQPVSHFELYLLAMEQAGADVNTMQTFLHKIEAGSRVEQALQSTVMPSATRNFVNTTFEIADSQNVCQIASAFTFGREKLLPDVFQRIASSLKVCTDGTFDAFEYYLIRHVELDGGEHTAMARELMETVCGNDPGKWSTAEQAAVKSLRARKLMWDALADDIVAGNPKPGLLGHS